MENKTYKKTARLFKFLSHYVRLQILDELRRREACVCHLQTVLGRPQVYISQQLRVLRDGGVVLDRKDGLNVFYRVADQQVERLLEDVLGQAGKPTRMQTCPCPFCQTEKG